MYIICVQNTPESELHQSCLHKINACTILCTSGLFHSLYLNSKRCNIKATWWLVTKTKLKSLQIQTNVWASVNQDLFVQEVTATFWWNSSPQNTDFMHHNTRSWQKSLTWSCTELLVSLKCYSSHICFLSVSNK